MDLNNNLACFDDIPTVLNNYYSKIKTYSLMLKLYIKELNNFYIVILLFWKYSFTENEKNVDCINL